MLTDEKGGMATVTIVERLPVEWRDPRHRHRSDAQLNSASKSTVSALSKGRSLFFHRESWASSIQVDLFQCPSLVSHRTVGCPTRSRRSSPSSPTPPTSPDSCRHGRTPASTCLVPAAATRRPSFASAGTGSRDHPQLPPLPCRAIPLELGRRNHRVRPQQPLRDRQVSGPFAYWNHTHRRPPR